MIISENISDKKVISVSTLTKCLLHEFVLKRGCF